MNDNKTVEQIREDVGEYLTSIGPGEFPSETQMEEFADEFVAAHKREIADFQRRYDECVRKFNAADLERVRLRDKVVSLNESLGKWIQYHETAKGERDACLDELKKKDAEIASLKQKIDEYERQPELMADVATKSLELHKRQDAEIAKLSSLVKELADVADEYFDDDRIRSLVAKAREVCNG